MGNRISIQFKNGEKSSPVFCSHWDGKDLLEKVEFFNKSIKKGSIYPLGRMEPSTVMVNFISWLLGGEIKDGNYYIVSEESQCDNSDNGHYVIDLEKKNYTVFVNDNLDCELDNEHDAVKEALAIYDQLRDEDRTDGKDRKIKVTVYNKDKNLINQFTNYEV